MTIEAEALEGKVKELGSQILGTSDAHDLIPGLIEELIGMFPCEGVTLFSLDRPYKQLVSCNFVSEEFPQLRVDLSPTSMVGYSTLNGKPLYLKDASDPSALVTINPNLQVGSSVDDVLQIDTRSVMVLPLPHKKKLVGIVEFVNKSGNGGFSEEDFKISKDLAPYLGLLVTKYETEVRENPGGDTVVATKSPAASQANVQEKLVKIINEIHSAKNVDEILIELKDKILQLFNASLITIYAVDTAKNEIFSKVKSGDKINEIRVPIAPQSIAGCVAMEQRMAIIKNVYDDKELKKFHPKLTFDSSWDKISGFKTKSMLVTPLLHKTGMMGVMQIINKKSEEGFNVLDEKNAKTIAETLALAFFNQSKFVQQKPTKFSYLLMNGVITESELKQATVRARKEQMDIENILLDEMEIPRKELGKSLENFFKVPYHGFEEGNVLPASIFEGLNQKETGIPRRFESGYPGLPAVHGCGR